MDSEQTLEGSSAKTHQFGEDRRHRDPARQRVGVASIRGEGPVGRLHRGGEAGRDRLLADRQVARALHVVLEEQVVGALLELAQGHLAAIELELELEVGRGDARQGPS